MSLCFATYGLGVVRRQRIRIGIDEDGLSFSPPPRRIAWNEVTRFRLAWFRPAETAHADGWSSRSKAAPRPCASIRGWDGFRELVGHVRRAAARQGVGARSNDARESRRAWGDGEPGTGGREDGRGRFGMSGNVLEVSDLRVEFRLHAQGVLRAVDGGVVPRPAREDGRAGRRIGSGKSVISQSVMGDPAVPRRGSVEGRSASARTPGQGRAWTSPRSTPTAGRCGRSAAGGSR